MNEFLEKAVKKLEDGAKADCGRYGNIMKNDVRDALIEFCRQDAEFAQAVVQGGEFKACMEKVSKGVTGSGISDMKAFGLAVEFYFPGAGIDVKMTIDLCASVRGEKAEAPAKSVIVDLSAFF